MAANLQNPPRHHYTLEEYYALERASEARFEYWDGEIVCRSGGSLRHYLISDTLHARLSNLLRGRQRRAFSGSVPIKTPSSPPYRYPDVSVVCGEIMTEKIGGIDVLTNPILVIEVLTKASPSTDPAPALPSRRLEPAAGMIILPKPDSPICFIQ